MFCVFLRIALRNNIFPTHVITINTYRQWVPQQNWWFIIDFPRKKINQLGALGFDVTMSLYRGQISRKSPNKMICRLSAQKIQKDAYAEEIPICVIQVSTLSLILCLNICQNLISVKTVFPGAHFMCTMIPSLLSVYLVLRVPFYSILPPIIM